MRHLIAPAVLLMAGLATLAPAPAAAQATTWSGANLVLTPLAGSTCRLAIDRAYLQGSGWSATIHIVFRNRGTAPVSVAADVELQGNGQRKSAPLGPFAIPAGAVSDQQGMAPFGGSLAGSTLRVAVTACTRAAS